MRQTPARTSTIRYGTHDASCACKASVSGRAAGVRECDERAFETLAAGVFRQGGDKSQIHPFADSQGQLRLGETMAGGEVDVLAGLVAGERVVLDPVKAGIQLKSLANASKKE